jgi:hypothetical protein
MSSNDHKQETFNLPNSNEDQVQNNKSFNPKGIRCITHRCIDEQGNVTRCHNEGIMYGTPRHMVGRYCMDPLTYNPIDGTKGMTPTNDETDNLHWYDTYYRPKKPKYNMKCTKMNMNDDDMWLIKEPEGWGVKNRWIWGENNRLCYYT